jgi:hypothetical protein
MMLDKIIGFCNVHPVAGFFILFFLGVFAVAFVSLPFNFIFKMYNRTIRSRNICAKGWPPSHLDADGDFKKEEE